MTQKARLVVAALGGIGVGLYALLVRGSLTVDLGLGRTVRPLGPFTVNMSVAARWVAMSGGVSGCPPVRSVIVTS
jgi:hypothetical protein